MENTPQFTPNPELKLMDQVREVLRYHHYAYRTEQAYCQWILRYIYYFGGKTHPQHLGARDIEQFLSHLASKGKVAQSTQRQALNALVFLYREVLNQPLEDKIAPVKCKQKRKLPVVLTGAEVVSVLAKMSGIHAIMAQLLYGGGLRLMECIRLRIQDIDFGQGLIFVRDGKGGKDRTTYLPEVIRVDLQAQVERVKHLHHEDLEQGFGQVYLPNALARKYPGAERETGWQYVFPAKNRSIDPRSDQKRRHHVQESGLQKAVKRAGKQACIDKRVTCHTFRHSFATHLLENGTNIRMVQKLMGHADVKTTEIYTHVMQSDLNLSKSPLDSLLQK